MKDLTILKIVNVIKYKSKQGVYLEKKQNFARLAIRLKGHSHFDLGKEFFSTNAGDIVIIPANCQYKRTSSYNEMISIHLQLLDDSLTKPIKITLKDNSKILQLFNDCLSVWDKKNDGYQLSAKRITYEIFELLYSENKSVFSTYSPIIENALNQIEKNFSNSNFNINSLAKSLYVSTSYLRKKFTQELNVSPIKYLNNFRINYAKQLLNLGSFSQQEVSQMCGFSDVKYFRAFFKVNLGMTISNFIKNK